jgi:hypothetical protein
VPPQEMVPGISGTNNPAPAKAGQRHSSPATEPGSDRGTLGGPVSAAVIKGGAAGGGAGEAEEPRVAATRPRQAEPGADPSGSVPPITAELIGPQTQPPAVDLDLDAGGVAALDDQSGPHGLVICAKSVRSPLPDEIATGDLRVADALGLRFPSAELVTAATALFEPATPWAADSGRRGTEPESGRFRITVGPGVIRLGWSNPVRAAKAAERAVRQHQRDVDDLKLGIEGDLALAAGDGDRAALSRTRRSPSALRQTASGGTITEWSRKSRSAMCRTFAELDYSPLAESNRIPAMITLTYPGDWEVVAPDGASVKRHIVLWRKRFQREYDEPARYIWKLEFQRRGAPHIHLWMAPPTVPGRSGRYFAQWLSEAWAGVVDHPNPVEKSRHLLAGTAVDVRNGLKAFDPKRLAIYFTKHSSPNLHGDKEYQHIVPELWRQPGNGPGRFWGVHGFKKALAVAEVAQDEYVAARRIIRRWSRNQAAYPDQAGRFPSSVNPRLAKVSVVRVDSATGRVRYRRVSRRRQLCTQGGLAGGFALTNNGPGFASQIARAISCAGYGHSKATFL